ncbi:hypothetical protein A9Q86_13975 [Flavobacteriales bacterium 33_180_T64]|nr:hypothetical protein A9Q86_13975 [Flavobacteriales bacterium 33_180_T64]
MRLITLFFMSFCLLVTNCKDDKVYKVIEETQEQIDARTIYQKDIEAIRYVEFELSKESRKGVNDWQKFQELIVHVGALKKVDFTFFKDDPTVIKVFLTDFELEMPESLQTNEILARITALETKALKLNSLLTINNMSKEEQIHGVKEFLITVSNLNLQINKKFEFEKNNIIKS